MKSSALVTLVLLTGIAHAADAPVGNEHAMSKDDIPPKDPAVQKKLEWWQDLKFGLLMHWGTYSQWGIVESWLICPEDEGWCQRRGPHASNYFGYVTAYENLRRTFNPVKFDPARWAATAKQAGMRYVVFTTKHHDGFCMFDTDQTDYKITAPDYWWPYFPPAILAGRTRARLVGYGDLAPAETVGDRVTFAIPEGAGRKLPVGCAWVFRL